MGPSITYCNLLLLIANVTILYLTIRWYLKKRTTETLIAIIASAINSITILANSYNEELQDKKLVELSNKQTISLNRTIDSLYNKNQKLFKINDSLVIKNRAYELNNTIQQGTVEGDSNTVNIANVNGFNNKVANSQNTGNNNIIINGNDRSRIEINPVERPLIKEQIKVGDFIKTDIFVHKGNKVLINATGSMRLGAFVGYSGPEGKLTGGLLNGPLEGYNLFLEYPHGSLILKPSDNADWLNCGSEYNFTADDDGFLQFDINDNKKNDNSGAYQVEVRVFK